MPASPPDVTVNVGGVINGDVNVDVKRSFSPRGAPYSAVKGIPAGDEVPSVTPGTGTGKPGKGWGSGRYDCGVSQELYDLCGSVIFINGYNVETSYENGTGQFHNVPKACVVLITTLGVQCPGEGVRPAVCGDGCVEYKGIDKGLWDWMGDTFQRVFSYKPGLGSGSGSGSGKKPY